MSQLRIALTLPGEASLGAFQAGATSALVVALQRINRDRRDDVRLDVMTGTSSGSLTAVLAAHALLTGRDPVDPLRRAWVLEPTIDALRGRDGRAPLTLDRAREVASEILTTGKPTAVSLGAQPTGITVNFALTSLRGLTYTITPIQEHANRVGIPGTKPEPTYATSHLDWAVHELRAWMRWEDVVDSAIASASHPAAFAPMLLDRSDLQRDYKRNGVNDFPECPVLWYADGGLLDREPLGRCIKVVRDSDSKDGSERRRMVLLLRPEPDVGFEASDHAWTEDDDTPSWRTVVARALRIVVTHSLYEDLRRVERVNSRIVWSEKVVELLEDLVRDEVDTREKIGGLIREIRAQKSDLRAGEHARQEALADNLTGLLSQLLDEASGLAGKEQIAVDVVSSPSAADVAGGSLLNFGGFLAERLRANDFLVGYVAMLKWMRSRGGHYFAERPVTAAEERATRIPGWVGGVAGRRSLSWRDRAHVLRIAGRAARIGLRGSK